MINATIQKLADVVSWYPPAKYAIDAAAALAHLGVDFALLELLKDWYATKAVEAMASIMSPLREEFGLPLVINGLSLYVDSLSESVGLEKVISATLDRSKQQFDLEEYQTFPLLRDLTLPIQKEPPPTAGTVAVSPPSLSGNKPQNRGAITNVINALEPLQKVVEGVNGALNRIRALFFFVPDSLKGLKLPSVIPPGAEDFEKLSEDRGRAYGWDSNPSVQHLFDYAEKQKLDWEQERRSQWVRATYPHVDELRRPFIDFFRTYIPCSAMDSFFLHWTNRYTISVSHRLRSKSPVSGNSGGQQKLTLLKELRKDLEKLRSDFQKFLDGAEDELTDATDTLLELQKLSSSLESLAGKAQASGLLQELGIDDQWLDLVKKHVSLSGQIGSSSQPDSDLDVETTDFQVIVKTIAWINYLGYLLDALDNLLTRIENLLDFGPPHMYVMKDSSALTKGNEPWTIDASRAEELFAVQLFVMRKTPAAILTPPLYPNPNRKGLVAIAEAMVYNANGREIENSAGGKTQPNTGWDTLNWTPDVKAPEWGLHESGGARKNDWLKPFTGGTNIAKDAPNRIRLNWQGKLVPIGPGRLRTAQFSPGVKSLIGADGGDSMLSQPDFVLH